MTTFNQLSFIAKFTTWIMVDFKNYMLLFHFKTWIWIWLTKFIDNKIEKLKVKNENEQLRVKVECVFLYKFGMNE